jgi:hypothetical protein
VAASFLTKGLQQRHAMGMMFARTFLRHGPGDTSHGRHTERTLGDANWSPEETVFSCLVLCRACGRFLMLAVYCSDVYFLAISIVILIVAFFAWERAGFRRLLDRKNEQLERMRGQIAYLKQLREQDWQMAGFDASFQDLPA